MPKKYWTPVLILPVLLILWACGGSDNTAVSPPPPPPGVLMGGNIQGVPLVLTGAVLTWAGDVVGGATDCTVGTGAAFSYPCGVATDGQFIYVADSSNHMIRKIAIATSAVTTVAGDGSGTTGATDCTVGTGATFNSPRHLTTDGQSLYVADSENHLIRKIEIATGAVTTVAGDGTGIPGATDCTVGTGASFGMPRAITTDGTFLYVADSDNHLIRRIAIGGTWTVTTLAGDGTGIPGATDCTVGIGATFNSPFGIVTDGQSIYVADSDNHLIRKIVIATSAVTTVAGDGTGIPGATDCTVGAGARFNTPYGIATDGRNLYIADTGNHLIRKIVIGSPWTVTAVAGVALTPGSADGTGGSATFHTPRSVTTDGSFLFIADASTNLIRRIH